ncbi:unnamed protein product [Haemonchus placei]|uniref:TATA-box-binding protein n=1 Tax=Haemonchus placei TaxID=6290 RepID=A0A0N4WHS7_HAEPC|nr:unnamed protein product [Haemonchus placei]
MVPLEGSRGEGFSTFHSPFNNVRETCLGKFLDCSGPLTKAAKPKPIDTYLQHDTLDVVIETITAIIDRDVTVQSSSSRLYGEAHQRIHSHATRSAYNSSFASTVVKKEEDGINDWKVQSKFSVPAVVTNALSFPYAAPYPSIQNIVATVDLGQRIDLKKLTLHSRNTEYNPKRFSAVIMRIREPRTTALIFSSGKMVTTGAKSESASRQASRKFARIVQKVGFNVKFADFKIQNVVGSCDVRFAIQLEGLCIMHAQFSTYEPELFPGLIYRMVHPRVVLLIFVSGKVVITGARHQDDIDQAFNHIYPILKRFRK